MADGPLSFATGYKQYDDLLAKAVADNQARLNAAPTSPLSNVDPIMLSLAQGLLSPTKTGGFGESLGIAANSIQAPLAAMQKQKLDAQGKIDELQLARAKLAMEAPYMAARAERYGRTGTGEGTPYSQMSALNTQLKAIVNMTDEEIEAAAAAEGFDQRAEIAAIVSQMSAIRKTMRGGNASGGGANGDVGGGGGSGSGAFPTITTRDAYDKLSPGSIYIDPEGNVRTKPAGPGERG